MSSSIFEMIAWELVGVLQSEIGGPIGEAAPWEETLRSDWLGNGGFLPTWGELCALAGGAPADPQNQDDSDWEVPDWLKKKFPATNAEIEKLF